MRESAKWLSVVLGWSVITAAIALPTLYDRLTPWARGATYWGDVAVYLEPLDLILLFLLSIFAGALLLDLRRIVLGYFGWLLISALLMFFFITLPARLDIMQPYLADFLQVNAIVLIFRSILFGPLFLGLIGAVFGGAIAEEMHLT